MLGTNKSVSNVMSKFELPKTLTIEDRRKLFFANEEMSELFGQDLVDSELLRLKVSDLIEIHHTPHQVDPLIKTAIKESPSKSHYKYLGEDVVDGKEGHVYIRQNQDQSSILTEMLHAIAIKKMPILADMGFGVHNINNNYFLWVNLEHTYETNAYGHQNWGHIQIPVETLIEDNFASLASYITSSIEEHFSRLDGYEISIELPFNKKSIIAYGEMNFGYKSKEIEDALLSMYEKKMITYPFTGSSYLPESAFKNRVNVLDSLALNFDVVSVANIAQKSEAFNDELLGTFHGIIPTENSQRIKVEDLPEIERDLYTIISMRYINQFLPIDPAQNLITKLIHSIEFQKIVDYFQNGLNNKQAVLTRDLEGDLLDETVAKLMGVDELQKSTTQLFVKLLKSIEDYHVDIRHNKEDGLYSMHVGDHSLTSTDSFQLIKKIYVFDKLGPSFMVENAELPKKHDMRM